MGDESSRPDEKRDVDKNEELKMQLPWYVTAVGAAIVSGVHYPLVDNKNGRSRARLNRSCIDVYRL